MSYKKEKTHKVIYIVAVFMTLIFLYAGHFLFQKLTHAPNTADNLDSAVEQLPDKAGKPVEYKHIKTHLNGKRQEIHILEVNIGDGRVEVMPVLSFGKVYGFDMLSNMAREHNAYAAINAGFFHKYGQPSGMVVIGGKMYTASTGKYPVLVISDGRAYLEEIETKLFMEYKDGQFYINGINMPGKQGEIVLYTPEYGTSNRLDKENITAVIRGNRIEQISQMPGECDIPDNGMLLSYVLPENERNREEEIFPFQFNDEVSFKYSPMLDENAHAYECGSWVVKDGEIVIGEQDEWVGVMTNRDPRTAVGIMDDGTMAFVVIDGRQPGYSEGLKGNELGEFLLGYGIKNAAMLDGGASSEMIIENRVVNKPSFKGQERPLAGAFVIRCSK